MNRVDPTSPFGHKIRPRHRARPAIAYVRQSTPQRVVSNRESADLQYQLRQRAVAPGWADDRVLVVDDDRRIGGTSAENRPGFPRLLAGVPLGHVGVVFGRETSRLARPRADGHRPLELCALFQVPLADADGVHDPADFNGRLLLGLKGTMREAESHILRARLHQGESNEARRGELFTCVPVGHVRVPEGGIAPDPDEPVRGVASPVLARFAGLGSLTETPAYLVANNIPFGLRVHKGPGKGRLVWQRPRRRSLYGMRHHPLYAGAYAFGRAPLDPTRRLPNKPKSGRRTAPPEEWIRLPEDEVPAHTSWGQYEQNQRRFAADDLGGGSEGIAGRAPTPLGAPVRCGRCGKPMGARNARADANPRYACASGHQGFGGPRRRSVVAAYPDRSIESLVLEAMEPAARELSMRAAGRAGRDREQLRTHWERRLERAVHEAGRAKRQYAAAGPANRLVARGLGRRREQKRGEKPTLGEDHARFRAEQPRHPRAAGRERIGARAADPPGLWRRATTTGGDRRSVARRPVDRVELTRRGETEHIDVVTHWRGGATTQHAVRQGLRTYRSLGGLAARRARMLELRGDGQTAEAVAVALNREGYHVARGDGFTGARVRQLPATFGQSGIPPGVGDASDLPGADECWLPEPSKRLGVKPVIRQRWRWSGWLHARQLRGENGRWVVWANVAEVTRPRHLRAFEIKHHGRRTPPAKLTTPAKRKGSDRSTTRSQKGGN